MPATAAAAADNGDNAEGLMWLRCAAAALRIGLSICVMSCAWHQMHVWVQVFAMYF
jgi:hypothetical protein